MVLHCGSHFTQLTSLLWLQSIIGGGSGANFTRHVKFIVLPLLMKRSEPPRISVMGSETKRKPLMELLCYGLHQAAKMTEASNVFFGTL
jgi:hypothetical protein